MSNFRWRNPEPNPAQDRIAGPVPRQNSAQLRNQQLSFAKMLCANETRESEAQFVLAKGDRCGFARKDWRLRSRTDSLGLVSAEAAQSVNERWAGLDLGSSLVAMVQTAVPRQNLIRAECGAILSFRYSLKSLNLIKNCFEESEVLSEAGTSLRACSANIYSISIVSQERRGFSL
jgi:hypothetical protein